MQQWQYQRCAVFYTTFLAEAHLRQGHIGMARTLVRQGLTLSQATAHRFGMGWAQRILGCVAQAAGMHEEAWRQSEASLATFSAIPARFEVGRTHLVLGEIAQTPGHDEAARQHLTEAYHQFLSLRVAPYVERTAHQARALGLLLPIDVSV